MNLKVEKPYNGMVAVRDYKLRLGENILECEGKTMKVRYPDDVVHLKPLSDRVHPSKFGRPYKLVYFMWKPDN